MILEEKSTCFAPFFTFERDPGVLEISVSSGFYDRLPGLHRAGRKLNCTPGLGSLAATSLVPDRGFMSGRLDTVRSVNLQHCGTCGLKETGLKIPIIRIGRSPRQQRLDGEGEKKKDPRVRPNTRALA